jgi:metal-sulfur cluster biosynthetic enzyme
MSTTLRFVEPLLADVHAACASVFDPEFGVSIDDLGLIYDVALVDGTASIAMTLTTPSCPAGDVIVDGVRAAVAAVRGVTSVDVRLVWDPQWTPEMINARGREQLGWRSA